MSTGSLRLIGERQAGERLLVTTRKTGPGKLLWMLGIPHTSRDAQHKEMFLHVKLPFHHLEQVIFVNCRRGRFILY